jgi:hypothetical protein
MHHHTPWVSRPALRSSLWFVRQSFRESAGLIGFRSIFDEIFAPELEIWRGCRNDSFADDTRTPLMQKAA